jgi:hypothetical protein
MGMGKQREPRPPDHTDAAERVAKELADISGRLAGVKGEAINWLRDPNLYTALQPFAMKLTRANMDL